MKKLTLSLFVIFLMSFPKVDAQEISTISQIYDYEIGDEFHVKDIYGPVAEIRSIFKITHKQLSLNGDTLTYYWHVNRVMYNFYEGDTTYSNFTDTIAYTKLDSVVHISVDTVYSNPELYNQRLINRDYDTSYYYYIEYNDYIVGCGGPYRSYSDAGGIYSFQNLCYFKKGNEEWGTELIVDVEDFQGDESEYLIFPNPADDFLFISLPENSFNAVIRFYDMTGQLLFQKEIRLSNDFIDVSRLSPGLYFLNLQSGDFNHKQKVVIR